jgi:hypothetical protein
MKRSVESSARSLARKRVFRHYLKKGYSKERAWGLAIEKFPYATKHGLEKWF